MRAIYNVYLVLNSAGRNREGLVGNRLDVGLQRIRWFLLLLPIVALCLMLLAQGALCSPPLERIGIRLASDRIAMDAEVLRRVFAPRREALGTTGAEHRFGLIFKTKGVQPATILQLPGLLGREAPIGLLASGIFNRRLSERASPPPWERASGDGRYAELGRALGRVFGSVLGLYFFLIASLTRLTAISSSFSDSEALLDNIARVLRCSGYGKVVRTESHWEFRPSSLGTRLRAFPIVKVDLVGDRAQIVGPLFVIGQLKQKLYATRDETYTGWQPWGAWGKSLVNFGTLVCLIFLVGAGFFASLLLITHH